MVSTLYSLILWIVMLLTYIFVSKVILFQQLESAMKKIALVLYIWKLVARFVQFSNIIVICIGIRWFAPPLAQCFPMTRVHFISINTLYIITLVPLSRFSSSIRLFQDIVVPHLLFLTQIQTCVAECPEKPPLVFKEVVKWCQTWQPLISWPNRVLEIPMMDLWALMAPSE